MAPGACIVKQKRLKRFHNTTIGNPQEFSTQNQSWVKTAFKSGGAPGAYYTACALTPGSFLRGTNDQDFDRARFLRR
jgi:hypothetical protein